MNTVNKPPARPVSSTRRIRMRKEDSAFVYFILESHEGICSYSTLPLEPGARHLDMLIRIPPGFEAEVEEVLKGIRAHLGEKIHELEQE